MVGYADDICVTGRMEEAVKQTYEELKRMVKEVGFENQWGEVKAKKVKGSEVNPLNTELNPICQ